MMQHICTMGQYSVYFSARIRFAIDANAFQLFFVSTEYDSILIGKRFMRFYNTIFLLCNDASFFNVICNNFYY